MSAVSFYEVIRRKARVARQLSRADWWIFLRAWGLLLAVDLGLRLLPFRWVQGYAARTQRRAGRPAGDGAGIPERVQRLVDIAARNHLYPMRCLPRALVLQRLLGRRGIPTDLRIGVRREGEELRAHAWLECAGRPVGEAEGALQPYAPLASSETRG